MIKTVVDLRSSFGPARDQDPRPTCMAFAASDAHAAARTDWDPLSAEWAYYHALKRDGGLPEDGVTLDAMLATIKTNGQPVEADWPYIKAPITDLKSWKPPAPVKQLFFRNHSTCSLIVQNIIERLDANTPVLITMTLSDAFYRPEANGIVERDEPIDPNRHHAVVAVGHGKRRADPFVLIRNSWGDAWGLNGHAWIAVRYLTPRLTGAAIMTTEP
jgi:C1A family cysteine protease